MFSPRTLHHVFPLIYKSLPNCKLQILLISAHGKLVLQRSHSVWGSPRFDSVGMDISSIECFGLIANKPFKVPVPGRKLMVIVEKGGRNMGIP